MDTVLHDDEPNAKTRKHEAKPRTFTFMRKQNIPSLIWKSSSSVSEMTYSRRIALYLSKYKWYNPKAKPRHTGDGEIDDLLLSSSSDESDADGDDDVDLVSASLERSWSYFENIILPRFTVDESNDFKFLTGPWFRALCSFKSLKYDKAAPGDTRKRTRLYDPLLTPLAQMGDFGMGVGLYFSLLRAFAVLMLLCGLINIPNVIYYASDDYCDANQSPYLFLKGSAICTDTSWEPCPNCTESEWDLDPSRFIVAPNITTDDDGNNITLTFALRNNCDGGRLNLGMVDLSTLIFITLGIRYIFKLQLKRMVMFDEDEQTARDYSIMVTNPPKDALTPNEWNEFFSKFDNVQHVTCVTVNVNNDLLVRTLVERREYLQRIKRLLPRHDQSLDELDLARIAAEIESQRAGILSRIKVLFLHPLGLCWDIPVLHGRLVVTNAKIRGLAQLKYDAINIFVTFETEKAQRSVLEALTVGQKALKENDLSKLQLESHAFRGKHVLDVQEAEEPSAIRWQDLTTDYVLFLRSRMYSMFFIFGAMFLLFVFMHSQRDQGAFFISTMITLSNIIFPRYAKFLNSMELHRSESGREASLVITLTIFQWINTAILIEILKPFTKTLGDDDSSLIPTVYAIYFSDIATANTVILCDFMGHIKRHILGPRATTQEGMNLLFKGSEYSLAIRFSNMTKIIILAFWYSVLYPSAYFLAAISLFITYHVDKFLVMRTWAPSPMLGRKLFDTIRRFYAPLMVFAFALSSSFYWTGFPFDNLCATSELPGDYYYTGTWTVHDDDNEEVVITVTQNTTVYTHCKQDFWERREFTFPALPEFENAWMTDEQETLTEIYGWTSLTIFIGVFIYMFIKAVKDYYEHTWGVYEPSGEDMKINYSTVESIDAYIPQVKSKQFSYPLIACSIEGINTGLFNWMDPDRPYSYYSLANDARELLAGNPITGNAVANVFDRLGYWPPPVRVRRMYESVINSNVSSLLGNYE